MIIDESSDLSLNDDELDNQKSDCETIPKSSLVTSSKNRLDQRFIFLNSLERKKKKCRDI